MIYAYIASRRARELGHTLVISGDGAGAVWGGVSFTPGPFSRKALIIWKTLEPNRLPGLRTLQPYMHGGLYAWAQTTPKPREPGADKPFARDVCRQLGMPEIVAVQKKSPWAGSLGERTNEQMIAHMTAVVDHSDYNWIRQFRFATPVQAGLLFRQYSLVRWLETNHKKGLAAQEIQEFSRAVRDSNDEDERSASAARFREKVRRYLPPAALSFGRRLRDRLKKSRSK